MARTAEARTGYNTMNCCALPRSFSVRMPPSACWVRSEPDQRLFERGTVESRTAPAVRHVSGLHGALKQRWAWLEAQLGLNPDRLEFIDETWASTNVAQTYGRAPRGERLRTAIPHGHWLTTTFVADLEGLLDLAGEAMCPDRSLPL